MATSSYGNLFNLQNANRGSMGSAPGGFGGIGIPARPVGPVTMGGVGSAPASYGGFPAHPVGNGGFNPYGGSAPPVTRVIGPGQTPPGGLVYADQQRSAYGGMQNPYMPANPVGGNMPGLSNPIAMGPGGSMPAQPVGNGGFPAWGGYGSGFPAQPVGGMPSGGPIGMWGGGMPGRAVGPAGYGGSPDLNNLMMLRRMGGY